MSYILDALKKAEAERNSGASSTVHSHPLLATTGKRSSRRRNSWRWGVSSVLTIALTGFAWFDATRGKAPLVPVAPVPSATQSTTSSPLEEKMPLAAVEKPVARNEKIARKAPEKKQRQASVEAKPIPASASSNEASLSTLRELPEQIQREIPVLAIGGYIYSGNRAERSVLINKRLLHEGDEAAPGLTLEKMMPNGMVLNYKGYRYRASY